jgi:uncharacterized protein YgbK (DUF1537 family)
MQHHPLTPMTDANLVRVLQPQVRHPVGLVDYASVVLGAQAIGQRLAQLRSQGCRFAVVDAVKNGDLIEIGRACAGMPLVTGGSGLAIGLPANFRRQGLLRDRGEAGRLLPSKGLRAVIAGSCSTATQAQVAAMRETRPSFRVDPAALARGEDVVAQALSWAQGCIADGPVLVYATAAPAEVKAAQQQFGAQRTGALVEEALAAIAAGLVERGVDQLIVAGGETSGAVVKHLGVPGLRIGAEIDPGVPWTQALGHAAGRGPLALALKSGNFGSEDFFLKAWERLP